MIHISKDKPARCIGKIPYQAIVKIVAGGAILLWTSATPVAAANASVLQQDVNALQNVGDTGVLAEVNDHGQVTTARAGVAKLGSPDPVPFDARYRTGSVTKTFTAVTVLQLVGEGELSLDDTVDKWLPGVVHGNGNDGTKITVRELLNHTSGLFDYTADDGFLSTILTPEAFFANNSHHYDPQDLINIALAHPPVAAPGTVWSYSTTNYILLGEIIKAVTDNPWNVELNNRIIQPLGLTGTTAPGDDMTIPGNHANGYNIYTKNANRVYTDTTLDNMSWGGAGGELISTTADENKFFSALLKGQILQPAQMTELKTLIPIGKNIGFGLGLVGQQLTCAPQTVYWHNGGTIGYGTWSGTTADGSLSLTISQSTTSFSGSDNTYSTSSANLTDKLIKHVFCGPNSSATDKLTEPDSPSSKVK